MSQRRHILHITMCSRIRGLSRLGPRSTFEEVDCRDTSAPPNRIAAAHYVRLRWWDVVNTETLSEIMCKTKQSEEIMLMPDHNEIYKEQAEMYERMISKQPILSGIINEIRDFRNLDVFDLVLDLKAI